MGQIILDDYLISKGLTPQACQKALSLSDNNIADHTLTFKVITETKSKGQFWTLQMFVDDYPGGLTIGLASYDESELLTTVEDLKKPPTGVGRRGLWFKRKQLVLWIVGKQRAAKQAREREARKKAQPEKQLKRRENRQQNLLPRALDSVAKTQKNIQGLQKTLRKTCRVLQRYILVHQKTPEAVELEKMLLAAMAYADANLTDQVVAATQDNKLIYLWDSEQNLVLKMPKGKAIEYQEVVFSFKEITLACKRVEALRIQLVQKRAEQWQARLLASIPEPLAAQIQALQQQAKHDWDRTLRLTDKDLKFLEDYQQPRFKFQRVEANIKTQEQMNEWVTAWCQRVEAAFAMPSPVDAATRTLLGLVACSPQYSLTIYAMWLGNPNAKSLQNKNLDEAFRGALQPHPIADIVAKLETLIDYQWLMVTKVGVRSLSALEITRRGKKVLLILEQKAIQARAASQTKAVRPVTL